MNWGSLILTLSVLLLAIAVHGRTTDSTFSSTNEAVAPEAGASTSQLHVAGEWLATVVARCVELLHGMAAAIAIYRCIKIMPVFLIHLCILTALPRAAHPSRAPLDV
jgi:hypothetical protein